MALTYYEILEVSPTASKAEIKKAYRKLQNEWHTDKLKGMKAQAEQNGASADDLRRFDLMFEVAEAKLKDFNEAYEVLSDDDKRARYDDSLKARASYTAPPAPVPPSIMITPNRLDFGKLKSGTGRYFHTFVISNGGGPVVGNSSLDFGMDTDWAEMQYEATDQTIFPITVKVLVDTNAISSGKHETVVVFEAASEVFEVPVIVEIEAVVISTPPPSPRPSTSATSSASSSAGSRPFSVSHTSVRSHSSRKSKWLLATVSAVFLIAVVSVIYIFFYHPPHLRTWLAQFFPNRHTIIAGTNSFNVYEPFQGPHPVWMVSWSDDSSIFVYGTREDSCPDPSDPVSRCENILHLVDADSLSELNQVMVEGIFHDIQISPNHEWIATVNARRSTASENIYIYHVLLISSSGQEYRSFSFEAPDVSSTASYALTRRNYHIYWSADSRFLRVAIVDYEHTLNPTIIPRLVLRVNGMEARVIQDTRDRNWQRYEPSSYPDLSPVTDKMTGLQWSLEAHNVYPAPDGSAVVYYSNNGGLYIYRF